MNQTELLKKELIEISNKLELSDGELLDVILDKADTQVLSTTIKQLQEWEMIEKIRKYFKLKYINKIEHSPDSYLNEFIIHMNNKIINIEIVSKRSAIINELDFINSSEEQYNFLIEMIENPAPEKIGAYLKIDADLYYREL